MRTLPLLLCALVLTACGDDAPPPSSGPPTVQVRVAAVDVEAEVADTEQEREVGLMDRTEVPLGTGMVFRWGVPSQDRFYMFHTKVPLTAVFASGGRVVGVYEMTPCLSEQPQACETYGPDVTYDTVLETAPETLRGKVAVGDPLAVGI